MKGFTCHDSGSEYVVCASIDPNIIEVLIVPRNSADPSAFKRRIRIDASTRFIELHRDDGSRSYIYLSNEYTFKTFAIHTIEMIEEELGVDLGWLRLYLESL